MGKVERNIACTSHLFHKILVQYLQWNTNIKLFVSQGSTSYCCSFMVPLFSFFSVDLFLLHKLNFILTLYGYQLYNFTCLINVVFFFFFFFRIQTFQRASKSLERFYFTIKISLLYSLVSRTPCINRK